VQKRLGGAALNVEGDQRRRDELLLHLVEVDAAVGAKGTNNKALIEFDGP